MRQKYISMIEEMYQIGDSDNGRLPGWMSTSDILLFRERGEQKYLDSILQIIKNILEDYHEIGIVQENLRLTGFKIPYRILRLFRVCLEEKLLSSTEIDDMKKFLSELLMELEYERGSMNRAFGFLASIHSILEMVPHHPHKKELLELEKIVLGDFTAHFEADEDSYGYGALTMMNMIIWLDESNREELYDHPKLRQCFENIFEMWSGSGRTPIFGDWRPYEPTWGWYIFVLEKAAAIYQDGRFKWAARVVFEDYERTMKQNPSLFTHHDLHGLAHACECMDESLPECLPESTSKILYRNNGSVERLILREGWMPGDMLCMISLANGNEHGHNDPLAINGIVSDKVILEDNGRQGVDSVYHNLLHVTDLKDDFPHAKSKVPSGHWQTLRTDFKSQRNYGRFRPELSFPFDYKHQVGNDIPREFTYKPKSEWVFILGMKVFGEGYTFKLRNLSLVGSHKKKVISDFEHWTDFPTVEYDDEGNRCGSFQIKRKPSDNPVKEGSDWATTTYIGVVLPGALSLKEGDYHSLEMEYYFSGNSAEEGIQLLCIGDQEGYPRKWMFNELPQYPVRVKNFQDNKAFSHGMFAFSEKSRSGRIIHRDREIFFTKDKIHNFFFISDRVFVEDDKPFMAAPLWHVMNPIDLGEGWFEIEYEGRALLWLLPKEGSELEVHQWKDLNYFKLDIFNSHVLYRGKECWGGKTEIFETLIIPLKPGEDGSLIRDSLSLVQWGQSERVLKIGMERQVLYGTI